MRRPARIKSGEAPIWMSQSVSSCVIAAERYSASMRRSHSPRTALDAAGAFMGLHRAALHFFERLLHVLRATSRDDEQCVVRDHDGEVVDADERDDLAPLRAKIADEVAPCVDEHRCLGGGVAVCVFFGELPGCLPTSDVAPPEAAVDDGHARRFLHHAVIDADGWKRREDVFDLCCFVAESSGAIDAL